MNVSSYDGFRVAIVGSCQVVGLRQWTERYLPGATVNAWHIDSSPAATPELVAPKTAGADLVITQLTPGRHGPLEFEALKARHANVVYVPLLVFPGFHPDLTFCHLDTKPAALLRGPLDVLQSEIVLAAYHLGLPVERVPRLFNALVFHALGYFTVFAQARSALVRIFAEQGYDLSESIDTWLRDGDFMYSDNHPHVRVLRTLARMALTKAGLGLADVPPEDVLPDALSSSVQWPTYPALARRIGIPGSTSFVRSLHSVPAGDRTVSLEAFVDESYRVLREASSLGLHLYPRTLQAAETIRSLLDTRGASAA